MTSSTPIPPPPKDWSRGAQMRYYEIVVTKKLVAQQEEAIEAISSSEGPHSASVWMAAAEWELPEFCRTRARWEPRGVVWYLRGFGYEAASPSQWHQVPSAAAQSDHGAPLELSLVIPGADEEAAELAHEPAHVEHLGHTWYSLDCTIGPVPAVHSSARLTWRAPRRLTHLREGLHDAVKSILGVDAFNEKFADTPFARHGGPPGTSGRLRKWLNRLAGLINNGEVSPAITHLVLQFLCAPQTELHAADALHNKILAAGDETEALDQDSGLRWQENDAIADAAAAFATGPIAEAARVDNAVAAAYDDLWGGLAEEPCWADVPVSAEASAVPIVTEAMVATPADDAQTVTEEIAIAQALGSPQMVAEEIAIAQAAAQADDAETIAEEVPIVQAAHADDTETVAEEVPIVQALLPAGEEDICGGGGGLPWPAGGPCAGGAAKKPSAWKMKMTIAEPGAIGAFIDKIGDNPETRSVMTSEFDVGEEDTGVR